MNQEKAVNKVLRDLEMADVIKKEDKSFARILLNALWVASREETIKEFSARNKRRVVWFNRDNKKMGTFSSIRKAAKEAGYGDRYRGGETIIANVLAGRYPHSREGYIWKYEEDVTPEDCR